MLLLRRLCSKSQQFVSTTAAWRDLLPSTTAANLTITRQEHASDASAAQPKEEFTTRTKRDNRIRFFVINNRSHEALELLERSIFGTPIVDPAGKKVRYLKLPPASVCNKVLHSSAQTRDGDLVLRAANITAALQLQGVTIETTTVQALIRSLIRCGAFDHAIQLLDSWLAANADIIQGDDDQAQEGPHQVMTMMLEAAARGDDPEALTQILLRMAKVGYSPKMKTMTLLLQCFTRMGHLNTAHGMLQWMRRSGLEPNDFSYSALMTLPSDLSSRHAAAQFLEKAKEAYQDMKTHNVPPSTHFFASYISVCGRLRDLDAAREAWLDMEATDTVTPDVVCYSTMIDTCAKGGDVDGALHLYEEMTGVQKIKPDAVAMATLISAVQGSLEQTQRVWRDMRAAGVKPFMNTWGVYLETLLRNGDDHGVLALLQDEGVLGGGEITQSQLYQQAIAAATRTTSETHHHHPLLVGAVSQMKARKVVPTVHMVTSLLLAIQRRAHVHMQGGDHQVVVPGWKLGITGDTHSQPLDVGGGGGDDTNIDCYDLMGHLVQALGTPTAEARRKLLTDATADLVAEPVEGTSSSAHHPTSSAHSTAAAVPVLIGWHAAEGDVEGAIDIYSRFSPTLEYHMTLWSLKMLIAAALALQPTTQLVDDDQGDDGGDGVSRQVKLILRIDSEARNWWANLSHHADHPDPDGSGSSTNNSSTYNCSTYNSSSSSSSSSSSARGWRWDQRTRRLIARALKHHSPEVVAGLLLNESGPWTTPTTTPTPPSSSSFEEDDEDDDSEEEE